jgi:hypothetical protein
MTISVVRATADQSLSATSDTLIDSMTITPAAGDYLALFTAYFENGATAKTYEFSLYVGGSIVQHTERRIDIEGSIAAVSNYTVICLAAWVSPTGSQAVEARYRRTTGSTASVMKRRTLTLFPKATADFQQDSSTADQTINSGTYTLLTGADLTPGAGTYLLVFSASATNSSVGATTNNVYYSVFVNGVQVAHTERILNAEASISANLGCMTGLIACKVTPTAGQVVDVRAKRDSTTNWVVHERTLTLMKVADADIKEASGTVDDADTSTTDVLLDNMTIADPGAADWLAIFSTSQGLGSITVDGGANYSIYNGGVRDDDSERIQTQENSIDNGNYYGFTHELLTVANGTDDVTVNWKGISTNSRTAHERTLVMVREAGAGAFSLTADPGSFALTGVAASPLAGRMVDAQPGSFALTGIAATLVRGFNLSVDPGAFALTGVDASFQVERAISADPGAFNVTGVAASLEAGRVLSADPGAYVLTGVLAELVKGYVIDASPGSFVVTGNAASLIADRVLSADPGAIVLTGVNASLLADRVLLAEPGVYAIAGIDALLIWSGSAAAFELSADPGVFVITGVDAALLVDRVLSADPGSLVITGVAATLVADRILNADPGAVTLTGLPTRALLDLDEFPPIGEGGGGNVFILNE